MSPRRVASFLGVVALAVWAALVSAVLPFASAQPPPVPPPPAPAPPLACSDVEVLFARGTGEPPGVGGIGQAFVDSLRTQLGDKSLTVYPINYPASSDFGGGMQFALTVVEGIRDASNHVQATAAACPDTKMVLGGFSQGAAVAGFTTTAEIPPGVPVNLVPPPMPPDVAEHVAAVALFGKPSDRWLRDVGAPTIVVGPLYVAKTTDLCAPGDTICDGAPVGGPTFAHNQYAANGMTNEAATFAVAQINQTPPTPTR